MRPIQSVRNALSRLVAVVRPGEREARLADEMQFHVEMHTEALVRSGVERSEARRRALIAFGGRQRWREEAREQFRAQALEQLAQDLRYGARSLLQARVFSAAAIGTLALGIGATTAMFSVVDAVLLRKLPYAEPNRLVMLWEHRLSNGPAHNVTSPANFLDWRDEARSFSSMAAFLTTRVTIIGTDGDPVSEQTRYANASLLPMLGVHPLIGRVYSDSEDQPGTPRVAVLDYRFWRQHFGGRADVVGKTVRINDQEVTVIGVLPRTFRFFEPAALWMPIRFSDKDRSSGGRYLRVVARLKPGITVEEADREMSAIARRRAIEAPDIDANHTALADPLHTDLVGDSRTPLLVLFGAVGCLMLIACANVANLLLARAGERQREMALRVALGASRRRIVRQLLTESLMLSVIGAALGVASAWTGTRLLAGSLPPQLGEVAAAGAGIDARALVFAVGMALLTGIAFGLAPALRAARGDPHDALREGGRGAGAGRSRRTDRLRSALVVAEISLSVVLLAGTGLMVRSLAKLRDVPLGFDAAHVLVADVVLQSRAYRDDSARVGFFEEAERRLAGLPGVRAVGAISWLPLSGQRSASSFTVVGQPAPPQGSEPVGDFRAVTPGYFRAMGIPVDEGRGIETTDQQQRPEVAVVSRTLARAFWPNASAVGHELRFEWDGWHTVRIVGVAGDVHHGGPRTDPYMEIYRPLQQFPYNGMTLVLRAAGEPMMLARPLRATLRTLDPSVAVAQLRPMRQLVSASVGDTRLGMILFAAFGAIGLVLAMIGIYGVGAYSVQQRRLEFGIRMALGAQRRDVLSMVLRRGLALAVIGIAAGVAGALGLTRLMQALLFDVRPDDLTTFVGVALLLGAVAALSAYLPARRATKVDPVSALRNG